MTNPNPFNIVCSTFNAIDRGCAGGGVNLPLGVASCALIDVCIGQSGSPFQTVDQALLAGFNRIRIRGNITETAAVIVLPAYVHIWIDGGATWTLPPNTTLDAAASVVVWISGNGVGKLVFSRTSSGTLITAPAGRPVLYMFENILIDFSATTVGNVQMCPKDALQRYRNLDVTLPNVADLSFFDFRVDTPFDPTDPEVSTSVENIILRGTGTTTSRIIGHAGAGLFATGNYSNITLTGILPVGDGSFTIPVIDLLGALGGGSFILDGLHSDVGGGITTFLDVILSGNISHITRRSSAGAPIFNVRLQGVGSGHSLSDSTIGLFEIVSQNGQVSDVVCGNLTVSGSNNGINNISNAFLVTVPMSVTGSGNRFTGCTFTTVTSVNPGATVGGDKNVFAGCVFSDFDPAVGVYLLVSGADNVLTGCSKSSGGSTRTLDISGQRNVVGSGNLRDTGGSTVNLIGGAATLDVVVSNNVFNVVIGNAGAATAGSIIAPNLIVP